jgi:hypothetical protein
VDETERRIPKEGDRVCFVGFRPRVWETVGVLEKFDTPFAFVRWDARPEKLAPIHPSQIEKIL